VHLLDGVDQIGQALERKVLALHGHDYASGLAAGRAQRANHPDHSRH
jgi:hypothetical protein